MLLENKRNILMGVDESSNTLEARQGQFDRIYKKMSTVEKIFGRSIINASNNMAELRHGAYMIENQYDFSRSCYGIVGFCLYVLFILSYAYYVLKANVSRSMKLFFISSAFIFAVNSYTLIVLVLFPNYMFFAMMYGYFQRVRIKGIS